MRRITAHDRPARAADPETFVGTALTQALAGRDDGLAVRVYRVSFEDGARMNWHRHDDVQLLYGLSGSCVVRGRTGEALPLEPGDLVVIEAGEEHWHGAAPGADGEHLAINLGSSTAWLERS